MGCRVNVALLLCREGGFYERWQLLRGRSVCGVKGGVNAVGELSVDQAVHVLGLRPRPVPPVSEGG
eukprot:6203153-Pleurochrysis_carterae.AAC.1